jgi:ATP-dependent exoDNAse (exonuclease V) alpha subunit
LTKPERVSPDTAEFFGKRQKKVSRRQLLVIEADAINVHKMQGDTTTKIVLDLGKNLFAKGMAYVGISRVKTLGGLAIICLDVNKLITSIRYTPCDTDALNELQRLRESFAHE